MCYLGPIRIKSPIPAGVYALLLAVLGAYANHFPNGFHFDDSHTILSNPYIQDLRNVPRFFVDVSTFSIFPGGQTYRPVTLTTVALDYWLGHGLNPVFFHLSTFAWYLVQLVLMVFLFRRIMDAAAPHHSNTWTALLATACYGLHPANAETVNYIIQRGDLFNTLGVVASVLWFAAYPGQRRRGWYLLPAIAGFLAKAPGLIYPFILLAYVFLFEQDADPKNWRDTFRATLPAFLVTAAGAILSAKMTSSAFTGGAISPLYYRLTQPWVALRYFKAFFLPTELSADNDWEYVSSPFSGEALAGYLFVTVLVAIAIRTARKPAMRPVSFGIWWFFLALLPTSLLPLSDVANDHRMFFPFAGLALAVFWSLRLLMLHWQKAGHPFSLAKLAKPALIVLSLVLLTAEAAGTRQRNEVWRSQESLWRDVIAKSPRNVRGLVLYSNIFMQQGDNAAAIPYLERAEKLSPDSSEVQVQLANAYGAVGRDQDAVKHYARGIVLAPTTSNPYFYYGQWLKSKGRLSEAQELLEKSLQVDPSQAATRYVLLDIYSALKNYAAFDAMVQETIERAKENESVRHYVEERANTERRARALGGEETTPEALLHLSSEDGKAGKYEESLAAAQKAIALRPDYAEAYNNVAAAYLGLHRWDEAVQAAQKALRLKPDFALAQKVLERAQASARGAALPAKIR